MPLYGEKQKGQKWWSPLSSDGVFGFEFELIMRRPSNINYLECRLSLNQLGSVERRDSIYSRSRTPVPDDVFLGPLKIWISLDFLQPIEDRAANKNHSKVGATNNSRSLRIQGQKGTLRITAMYDMRFDIFGTNIIYRRICLRKNPYARLGGGNVTFILYRIHLHSLELSVVGNPSNIFLISILPFEL